MSKMFPQFDMYSGKVLLSYNDISNILIAMVELRNTWSIINLKNTTKRCLEKYEHQLDDKKKVVLSNAVRMLRFHLRMELAVTNHFFISQEQLKSLLVIHVLPSVNQHKHRQKLFELSPQ